MGFLKKNIIFTIVVLVCLLAFGAGAYFAFAESGKIGQAKQKIDDAKVQLDQVRLADPAPSEANVEASQANAAALAAKLEKVREDLERGARITPSTSGVGVMASIQQYISEYQRKAAAHTSKNGDEDPIEVPEDFAFGFERYLDEATMLDDAADQKRIRVLDKQRQILSYLLDRLFSADPESVTSVQREVLELDASDQDNPKGLKVSEAVSARVPGAIDTLAFSLTFTGYTDSLRIFLNKLAKFDLPVVVRSIEVERPAGKSTTDTDKRESNSLDAIFGDFGAGSETEKEEPKEAQKPVISENTSTFKVVLEFIEIVLPADTAEDNI